jgi:UDP-glucose 4-epimerase
MRVMILGATGFAGRPLIALLSQRHPDAEVTVVSRTISRLPGAQRVVCGHYAELAYSSDFRSALARSDALVHLADGFSVLQSHRVNGFGLSLANRLIDASMRLAIAAQEAGTPLFVYISSIKAVCDEENARLLDEQSAARGTTLYGMSKLRLERQLIGALDGTATRVVIIRNPVMYAEDGTGESLSRLLRLSNTPYPLPFARVHNRRSILCVRNLASAVHALIDSTAQATGVYQLHDGLALGTDEIVKTFRETLGRPRRLFPVGDRLPFLARPLSLIGPSARRLYGSLELSDARFRSTIDWSPVVETRTALRAMAESYAQSIRGRGISRLFVQGSQ